jgi:hypothetical protein
MALKSPTFDCDCDGDEDEQLKKSTQTKKMNDDDGMLIQGEVRAPTSAQRRAVCAVDCVCAGVLCLTKPVFVPVVNLSALTGQPVRRLVLCGNSGAAR